METPVSSHPPSEDEGNANDKQDVSTTPLANPPLLSRLFLPAPFDRRQSELNKGNYL